VPFRCSPSVAIGEKAVVADAGEAFWDDVHEEAAEEFDGRKVHRFPGIAVVIVAIPEGDELAVEGNDALARDRDPVRGAGAPEPRKRAATNQPFPSPR